MYVLCVHKHPYEITLRYRHACWPTVMCPSVAAW